MSRTSTFRTSAGYATHLAGAVVRRPSEAVNVMRYLRTRNASPMQLRLPWVSFELIRFLERRVHPGTRVFEFGGGGSTAFFADRGAEVTTVEHDEHWFRDLRELLASAPNVTLLHRSPADDYTEYVDSVGGFPDDWFDVVVVDGRERVRCAAAARPKVRPGGLLLIDDIERARYAPAADALADWPYRCFRGIAPCKATVAHTGVWTRPA